MSYSPSQTHKSVLESYKKKIEKGELSDDPAQLSVIRALDELNQELAERKLANKSSSLGWLFSKRKSAWAGAKGLYIWGGVGRGKTMLMDLFFDYSPIRRKSRVHFHEFMADVHERIHKHREAVKAGEKVGDDPIPPVADAIADEVRLLCFDEFTVRDIADAMIMRRLFSKLFDHNVVIVATSNVAPDNLYEDGLRRADFMPFVAMLKERVRVLELDSPSDHRLAKLGDQPIYTNPLGAEAENILNKAWAVMLRGAAETESSIMMKGRELDVPRSGAGAARFHFNDLCAKPLGSNDYLAIAKRFHTVFIDEIPAFTPELRNEAKRFINLVDALYDARVKIVVSAALPPEQLGSNLTKVEAFEFDRTASRLFEMQSDAYLAEPHGKAA